MTTLIFGVGSRIVSQNEVSLKYRSFETDFPFNIKQIILSGVMAGTISNPRLNFLNKNFRDNYEINIDVKKSWVANQHIITFILSLKEEGVPFPVTDAIGTEDYFFEIKFDKSGNEYGYGANHYYCSALSVDLLPGSGLFADRVLFSS